MKRKIIDISTEEKKKDVFDKFNSFTSKNQAHEYFGISDNKQGSEYLKEIAKSVGFDINLYKAKKKKPIRYCKKCGKEINSKWGKVFCSSACAAKYNISATSLVYWLRRYREKGEAGLKSMIGKYRGPKKGRPKGTLKPKTTIEELQKENLKLQVEIERLKKGYLTKGVGAKKGFISINNKNFKSLEN